jgi:hypothetical protein
VTAHKDASVAKNAIEATFVWFCGQFSLGWLQKPRELKGILGDRASREDLGENGFWAIDVATAQVVLQVSTLHRRQSCNPS